MKKLLLMAAMAFYGTAAYSQKTVKPDSLMLKARLMTLSKSRYYNPEGAFAIYQQKALKGNGRAMNALGNLYATGLGCQLDNDEAFKWYRKATEAQYMRAWFNVGEMHKFGYGTPQDFKAAYEAFCEGVKHNVSSCFYGKGYFLYKGLGVTQNYEAAVEAFKKGIQLKSRGSMYMLGLCYRNGYGITLNTDSARFWIKKAADAGYKYALEELLEPESELTANIAENNQNLALLARDVAPAPQTYQKTVQNIKRKTPGGTYTGIAITYDWSGKHIIRSSRVTLSLEGNRKQLAGTWTENDSISVAIIAHLTDTNLVFDPVRFHKSRHYSRGKLMEFEFREARLQLNQADGKNFLTGNIQLWNNTRLEPEQKMYISLAETVQVPQQAVAAAPQQRGIKPELTGAEIPAIHKLTAYPNPFGPRINLSFYMQEKGKAAITVSDIHGRGLYYKNGLIFEKGTHTYSFENNFPPGVYVLRLQHDGQTETTILIKH